MNKSKTFRKSDILFHIVKGWRMVLICTLVGLIVGVTVIGAGYIRGEVSKEYRITSSAAVIVTNQDVSVATPSDTNLNTARSLVDSAVYVMKSQKNMDAVIRELKLKGISSGDISRNLTVTRTGETEIIEITLLWRSEKEGLSIMKTLNRVTSSVLKDTLKMGYLSVINEPKASFIVGGNINISTWIYAALVGLLIGIGVCVLRFIFMPTIINEDDITVLFGVDTLGALPLDKRYARQKPLTKSDLPIMDDIKSSAHLLLSHLEGAGVNKLYVTSTKHDEGKTRLIADIGLQFARLGKKTLLIDCNFTNPMLGALFMQELQYEQTLNALYRGDSDKLDAISHINGCLDILPCVLERNPENLNDALLMELKKVMDGYDYVLIDAAPIGLDAEVLRLNEITDTVLYVVRFDDPKVDDVKRALQRIAKSGHPVVGVVFNCVINWRQTIINAPKRLGNSLKRETKRRAKEEKKRTAYQEKKQQKNAEKKPTARFLDGVAPSEEKTAEPQPDSDKTEKKAKRKKKRSAKKAEAPVQAESPENEE